MKVWKGIALTLIIFICVGCGMADTKEDGGDKGTVEFTEVEKEVIALIYDKLDIMNYFDEENLDYFKIVKMMNVGYFESRSNIRYIQINYEFLCKDGTNKCNKLLNNQETDSILYCFQIKLNANDRDYIEFRTEELEDMVYFDSDWVQNNSSLDDFSVYTSIAGDKARTIEDMLDDLEMRKTIFYDGKGISLA